MAGQKGNNFERDVCRRLSLWWTDGQDDDCFWRNKLRRTNKAYNAQMQEGDIIATKEIAIPFTERFCIECKSGYSLRKKTKAKRVIPPYSIKQHAKTPVKNVPWDLLDLIDGNQKEPVIVKFWQQTITQSTLTKKIPILIFKRDFHTPVICIGEDLLTELNLPEGFDTIVLSLHYDGQVLRFMNLEAFLLIVPPQAFKDMITPYKKAREIRK